MTTSINQKEYLKKYLGIGKTSAKKKNKKKKEKLVGTGLKIVDDDVDAIMAQQIQEDLAAENEDAPQIVAVIDERPISMQIDEHTNTSLWKPVGEPPSVINENRSVKVNSFMLNKQVKVKKEPVTETYSKHSNNEKADASMIHIKQENRERSSSPLRRKEKSKNNSGGDISRKKNQYDSPLQKDCSPPRNETSDYSPPRRKRRSSLSPQYHGSEKDMSPPRSKRDYSTKGSDDSFPRRKRSDEKDNPPLSRKNRQEDNSPKRRNKDMDNSPPRKKQKDSPLRRGHREVRKKSRWNPEESPDCTEKMGKTLDGKKAGLQNAKNLSKETALLREKEDEIFKNLSAEISGKNATTVYRNKKIKDLEEEAAKTRREKEMKEKYDLWGKGLKQVEDRNHHIEEQLHEMSKPLARYADDEDLEKFLKEQERDGDPMLSYIRKKKKKEKVVAGVPEKPMYMGEFMPNRFGVRPGYRWDGVDRSNGYEKKWFEVQNSKRANQEEAFKWSTEDM